MKELIKMIKKDIEEATEEQQRERDIKDIQDYSKFVPSKNINTPEELAKWLNDDNWE